MTRVRAPELIASGDWLNVDSPITLAAQRGRFVMLDFWTFCCANCLHVLDELRPLDAEFGHILTIVGVHSPKFPHEADPVALAAALERYEVHHPVVNDPELRLWQQYAVRAWPTLVLIDPEGYVVAQAAGEGQVSALAATITSYVAEHETYGKQPRPGSTTSRQPRPVPSTLRFPAKAIVLPASRTGRAADTLLVADAGQHALVELAADGSTPLNRIGAGARGLRNGSAARARFAEPNGLALLPAGLVDYDVVVADTANHVLRGVRLSDGAVLATIDLAAGLSDARTITGAIPGVLSPWDVAWWPAAERIVVAAAGVHLLLSVDPVSAAVEVLAGTTVEGLRDGSALDGWLAQPSGLAVDGSRLWFVDAETSALRYLQLSGADRSLAELHTVVGAGLFDFGHVDGPAADARLQHPLGLALLADGSVAVCDTYNGAIRRYDPETSDVSTLAGGLAEPSGAVLVDGELLVVESAAHRLVRPHSQSSVVIGAPLQTPRAVTDIGPETLTLRVEFEAAPGRKLDDQYGPSTRLTVSASPPELIAAGAGESPSLTREVRLGKLAEGVLHITAQAASCDEDGEHPACYLARQDWGVPVRVREDGPTELTLVLLG